MAKKSKPNVVPLTGLDATFLHLETAQTPMHVGAVHRFELPAGKRRNFTQQVRDHLAKRLHLAPMFTRKLMVMPFDLANPVWVDDHQVDLDLHVIRTKLPKPGTDAQLNQKVGELHAKLLDRQRPLWEFYVIEGLESGRVALYSKMHHAAVDGQAGVALANAILDLTETPRQVKPREGPAVARDSLGTAELIGAVLANQLQQTAGLLKMLPGASKALGSGALSLVSEKVGQVIKRKPAEGNWKLGPRTVLNVNISAQRSFATVSVPLASLKLIGRVFDASLNDVVLAICSGALREYLQLRNSLPKQSLTAAVPVSMRTAGQEAAGNQVTMTLVELATNLADPAKRLRKILENSARMKGSLGTLKQAMPTDFPSIGAPWLMSGLNSLYGRSRLAERVKPLANVVISNVPGPNVPLFLAGGKMLTYHPVSIVVHGIALNITLQSYNGSMDFGLIACAEAMPDTEQFGTLLHQAFEQLLRLAEKHQLDSATKEALSGSKVATRAKKPPATRARGPVSNTRRNRRSTAE